jgi:hypothetical protein
MLLHQSRLSVAASLSAKGSGFLFAAEKVYEQEENNESHKDGSRDFNDVPHAEG